MRTEINGRAFECAVRDDETAVEVIRERARLTGAKLVCGAGVCGACTVRVDGLPLCSCLLPARQLEGKKIETIEAYGPDNLHPVQRAFMACDALQCGYCTPGFIMEGIDFYEKWKAARAGERPSREEVAAALAGHLCRCGAYVGICEAMQRACAGEFDEALPPGGWPRVDALPKVTGQATYATDIRYEGQLCGRLLRSPHPHARIRRIDTAAAEAMPGVRAVVRLKDEGEEVKYVGEEILALAADTEAQALDALAAVHMEYDVLPFIVSFDKARAGEGPEVHPGSKKDLPNAAEGMSVPGTWEGNLRTARLNIGASKAGAARRQLTRAAATAPPFFRAAFRTARQIHTCLEPHATVASWEAGGSLTVHVSTQAVYELAGEIARAFKLPADKVRVVCEHTGGGFGAKLNMRADTVAAVRLARAAGAPVAVVLDRAEEMAVGGYRPGTHIEVEATLENGVPHLQARAYADAGVAYSSFVANHFGNAYKGPRRDVADIDVVTHLAPGCSFRCPGGPNAAFAIEQTLDDLAHQQGVDPIALRRRFDRSEIYDSLYEWVEKLPAWRERPPAAGGEGRFRRGLGVAFGRWFHFYVPATEVEVTAGPGGLVARCATQDMGQGARTVIARAVAGVFSIAPTDVRVEIGDSGYVRGPASGGSRTSVSLFAPAEEAAGQVREQLVNAANRILKLTNARAAPGGLRHEGGFLPWAALLPRLPTLVKATAQRGRNSALDLLGLSGYVMPGGLAMGKGAASAACVAEVEVDTLLGRVRVTRVWSAIRAGRMYAPELARSQCYGAIIQNVGFALYEERRDCPRTGQLLTFGLEDYRIPGIGDVPDIHVDFIEEGFDDVKGQGIGIGEVSTAPVAAAIANAVCHATGWRPLEIPLRPDRLLAGLKRQEASAKNAQ